LLARNHSAGAGRHPLADRGEDLYETPPCAVRALLIVEPLPQRIWEPACGPGSIVRVLRKAGHSVVATDLVDYRCPNSTPGVDFLKAAHCPRGVECIITNPPYKLAGQFVRKALDLSPMVVMLLRLAFLESVNRNDILDGGKLAWVYPFRNRLPMMHRNGWKGPRASSSIAFAWMVWQRSHRGPAKLHRISWQGVE
jgi:hypothetical protein